MLTTAPAKPASCKASSRGGGVLLRALPNIARGSSNRVFLRHVAGHPVGLRKGQDQILNLSQGLFRRAPRALANRAASRGGCAREGAVGRHREGLLLGGGQWARFAFSSRVSSASRRISFHRLSRARSHGPPSIATAMPAASRGVPPVLPRAAAQCSGHRVLLGGLRLVAL